MRLTVCKTFGNDVGDVVIGYGPVRVESDDVRLVSWLKEVLREDGSLVVDRPFVLEDGNAGSGDVRFAPEDPGYPGALMQALPRGYMLRQFVAPST